MASSVAVLQPVVTDVVQVHLLCLLSHAQHMNRLCNDELLKAAALSLLPSERISPNTWRLSTLTDYIYWFKQTVGVDKQLKTKTRDMVGVTLHAVRLFGFESSSNQLKVTPSNLRTSIQ